MTELAKYQALENKEVESTIENVTMFVVRDTNHPAEDLQRNFSAPLGGFSAEYAEQYNTIFETEEEAKSAADSFDPDNSLSFAYHPAYAGFVEIHYHGLGAFVLTAETVEEAIKEANEYSPENDLSVESEMGDGHFTARQVVSYHKVREGRYVFQTKFD